MKCEKTCLGLLMFIVLESSCLHVTENWREENQYNLEEGENNTGKCHILFGSLQADKEPIFIDTRFERLVRPKSFQGHEREIVIGDGETLLMACPGKGNKVSYFQHQSEQLVCRSGQLIFESYNRKATRDTLSCSDTYSQNTVKSTGMPCGGNTSPGIMMDLGFEFVKPGRKIASWYPQVFLCRNKSNHTTNTFYSSHRVYGQALEENTRGNIDKDNRELKTERIYRKIIQQLSFDEALGFGAGDEFIKDDGKSVLAEGQLAPEEDFLYHSEQMMTHDRLNSAPQWVAVKQGSWLTIERSIRQLAVKMNSTLEVHSGTHGVLKLSYGNGRKQEVYLMDRGFRECSEFRIPVPEVFWKVVQHPTTRACTVVVVHNDIFLTTPPPSLCRLSTVTHLWPSFHVDLSKGYFYYCDYSSFLEAFPVSPVMDCNGILLGG